LLILIPGMSQLEHTFSMQTKKEPGLYPIPKNLCTPAEKIFFLIAQNIYASANRDTQLASQIIHDVSLLNPHLYKALDEERNNPVVARTIIEQFALLKDGFRFGIAKQLTFPGAKKCLELSKKLYNENLTVTDIEQLFKQGAIINYELNDDVSPLSYWTNSDDTNSLIIIKKLIALGANPNYESIWGNNSFFLAIGKQNRDKLNALLNYYKLMHGKSALSTAVWSTILLLYYRDLGHYKQCPELIDYLISNVPKESCSSGLIACLDVKEDLQKEQRTQLMKNFIKYGADTGPAMAHLLEHVELWTRDSSSSDFIKDFNILCDAGAFDEEALTILESLSELFDSLIIKLKKNSLK
jgi:hypothetical protein